MQISLCSHEVKSRMDLRPLTQLDLNAAHGLLAAHDLPIDDLADPAITLIGAFEAKALVGVVGLQACGDCGLLRSLAVESGARSRGCGRVLSEYVLALAASRGMRPVFLLTTNAADYFARLGFETIEREDVPASIRATSQFSSLCPASARVMRSGR
jgi:amino-acid N-acetyltransferase